MRSYSSSLNAFHRQGYPALKFLLVRINASEEERSKRGWVKGDIDKDSTETNLDDYDGKPFS